MPHTNLFDQFELAVGAHRKKKTQRILFFRFLKLSFFFLSFKKIFFWYWTVCCAPCNIERRALNMARNQTLWCTVSTFLSLWLLRPSLLLERHLLFHIVHARKRRSANRATGALSPVFWAWRTFPPNLWRNCRVCVQQNDRKRRVPCSIPAAVLEQQQCLPVLVFGAVLPSCLVANKTPENFNFCSFDERGEG